MIPGSPSPGDTWHVYTDGSSRHEKRQTFSGWAARAVQPHSRQVRQASGAQPGGDSLSAERTAILEGLRLVPPGAVAQLYCDLELKAILSVLEAPAGEAARAHLREVLVHPVVRNRDAHQREMHRVSRALEQVARDGTHEDTAGLSNAAHEALVVARAADSNPAELRSESLPLPGFAEPPLVRLVGARYADLTSDEQRQRGRSRAGATLDLELAGIQGAGRDEREAALQALRRALTALAALGVLHVRVPPGLEPAVRTVARELPGLRLVTGEAGDAGGPATPDEGNVSDHPG